MSTSRANIITVEENVHESRQQRVQKLNNIICGNPLLSWMSLEDIRSTLLAQIPPQSSLSYQKCRAAFDAMAALWWLELPDQSLYKGIFAPLWPYICAWLAISIEKFILGRLLSSADEEKLIFIAVSALYIPASCGRRYSDHIKEFDIPQELGTVVLKLALRLLDTNHSCFELLWNQFFQLWASTLRKNPDMIHVATQCHAAQICVRSLRAALDAPELDPYLVNAIVTLSASFAMHSNESRRLLLSKGIVRKTARVLSRIATIQSNILGGDTSMAAFAVVHSCCILKLAVEDGITWITKALNGHVIRSLVTLLQVSPPGILRIAYGAQLQDHADFIEAMKPSLVFRSVLNRVLKEMDSISQSRLLDGLKKDEKLRKSIVDMHEEAIELKKGMKRFDEEASYTYCCNHDSCPWEKRKRPVNFKRCANCGIPTYCCRECQKANWKIHKRHCQLSVGPAQGYTYALSYLDHGFIRYISSIHLDLRKQGLQRLVASNTNPDAVLAITFNYSVYPTQVLVDLVNGKPEKIECCLQHIQWQAEERFWGQQLGIKVNLRVLFPGKNHDGLGGEGLTIHGEDPPP